MDIAKDLLASLRQRVSPVGHGAGAGRPAWSELHARLSAAHAAAGAFAAAGAASPSGGFELWQARPGEHPSRRVNRIDSADGKNAGCIEIGTAGDPEAGGRGQ